MNKLSDLFNIGVDLLKNTDKLIKILLIFIVAAIINYFLAYKTSEPYVYTYNEKAKTINKARTLSLPVIEVKTLSNNVDQALFDTFNFDSSNYKDKIEKALNKWYTQEGAEDVYENITNLNNGNGSFLDFMFENRITSQAHILPGTSLIKAKMINGKIAWQTGSRMVLTYRNQFGYSSTNIVDVSVWVVETDTGDNPNAIGIRSIRLL